MTFRYFVDPHGSTASTWSDEPKTCGICGEERPGYEGPYYGLGDLKFVCEPCLSSGRLTEGDFRTNEGAAGPDPSRREELERRTPGLVTWQDWEWPAHCGDFCRFEQEVGQREIEALAGGNGFTFFKEHHPDQNELGIEWDWVPARAPSSREESNSPSVYLFRCLVCSRPLFVWDVD